MNIVLKLTFEKLKGDQYPPLDEFGGPRWKCQNSKAS